MQNGVGFSLPYLQFSSMELFCSTVNKAGDSIMSKDGISFQAEAGIEFAPSLQILQLVEGES